MFGLGKRNQRLKIADKIGFHIHAQFLKTIETSKTLGENDEDIMFLYKYIDGFASGYFIRADDSFFNPPSDKECEIFSEMVKHICDGVMPVKLWNIYEAGENLQFKKYQNREDYKKLLKIKNIADDIARHDVENLWDSRTKPTGLYNYFIERVDE
jgi:hypothetical protein